MELFSPAKINLGLSVVGIRQDGFHLLESLFWPITFGDTIQVNEGSGRVFTSWNSLAPYPSHNVPTESENVVTKVLKGCVNFSTHLDFEISKCIPIGGGLGGGSSNAGTVLKFLRATDNIKIHDIETWSAQFGADIPFFLSSKPAWVTGIGEVVMPLRLEKSVPEKLHFLLVVFPFGCETRRIFQQYRGQSTQYSIPVRPFTQNEISFQELKSFLKSTKNDLEPIVSQIYPQIASVLDRLRETDCIYSGLSGSGSTCVAVFESAEKREKSAQELHSFFRTSDCRSIFAETFTTR